MTTQKLTDNGMFGDDGRVLTAEEEAEAVVGLMELDMSARARTKGKELAGISVREAGRGEDAVLYKIITQEKPYNPGEQR